MEQCMFLIHIYIHMQSSDVPSQSNGGVSSSSNRSQVANALATDRPVFDVVDAERHVPIEVADAEEILKERDACGVRVSMCFWLRCGSSRSGRTNLYYYPFSAHE